MTFGSEVLRKKRTEPSQKANMAPLGWRLLNACGAVPLIWALAWSTYHITSLMWTDPDPALGATQPLIPAQMQAVLPTLSSYMHSPRARVLLEPSWMSVTLTVLSW